MTSGTGHIAIDVLRAQYELLGTARNAGERRTYESRTGRDAFVLQQALIELNGRRGGDARLSSNDGLLAERGLITDRSRLDELLNLEASQRAAYLREHHIIEENGKFFDTTKATAGEATKALLTSAMDGIGQLGDAQKEAMRQALERREAEEQRRLIEHLAAMDGHSRIGGFDYGDPRQYGSRHYGPFIEDSRPGTGIYGQYDRPDLQSLGGVSQRIIGQKLDLDLSLLKPNKNGIALVVAATGRRAPGVPGVIMAVDTKTGVVVDSFEFVGGGAGPSSENEINGITPGLSGELDFDPHQDVQARWGLRGIKYGGAMHWRDGDGVKWHILTEDPHPNRAGMWIHPSNGNTYGCLGMKPAVATRFRRYWEQQEDFSEMTFVTQDVLKRSIEPTIAPTARVAPVINTAAAGDQGLPQEITANTHIQNAVLQLRHSVVAASLLIESPANQDRTRIQEGLREVAALTFARQGFDLEADETDVAAPTAAIAAKFAHQKAPLTVA